MVDSVPFSLGGSSVVAHAWKKHPESPVDGVFGYLGTITPARVGHILDAGMAFSPVTYAGEYNDGAADELAQLSALGIPKGATVFLDFEGPKVAKTPEDEIPLLLTKMKNWARSIQANGYEAGLYVGVPQPLTSRELYDLPFTKYWQGMGSTRDRYGELAEPFRDWSNLRGWNVRQFAPSKILSGLLIDFNMVGVDYRGQVFHWVMR